jgi:hypothetical protein
MNMTCDRGHAVLMVEVYLQSEIREALIRAERSTALAEDSCG